MKLLVCLLLTLGLASVSSAQVSVEITTTQTGSASAVFNTYSPTSLSSRAKIVAIGQTFQTPGNDTYFLNSFTVSIKDTAALTGINAFIQEWNTSTDIEAPVNSPLWSTPAAITITQTTRPRDQQFRTYTFNIGGLLLDSAKTYVAYFTLPNERIITFGTSGSAYADGEVVSGLTTQSLVPSNKFPFFTWGNNSSLWTSYPNNDLAFTANFTAVPEPSTYALGGVGSLLAIAALRRRRKVS